MDTKGPQGRQARRGAQAQLALSGLKGSLAQQEGQQGQLALRAETEPPGQPALPGLLAPMGLKAPLAPRDRKGTLAEWARLAR